MRHFILASHGTFSEGIYNSVKIIMGDQPNVHVITAYVEEGQDIKALISQEVSSISTEDEVVICTDVFGGSVNNEMMMYLNRPHFHLITGMNLPLLMNLFLRTDEDAATVIRQSLLEAKDGMIYCNDTFGKVAEEGEF